MALYKFVGCGKSNRIFNLLLVQAEHMKKRQDKIKSRLCFSQKVFGNEKMKSAVRMFVIRLKRG